MRQRGVSFQKIADKFGMSKATVHKIYSSLCTNIHSRTIFDVMKDTTLKERLRNDPDLDFSESKLEMYLKSSAKRSSFALLLDGSIDEVADGNPVTEQTLPGKSTEEGKEPAKKQAAQKTKKKSNSK